MPFQPFRQPHNSPAYHVAGNFSFAFRQENISGYVHMTLSAFIGIADSVYLIFLLFTSRPMFPERIIFRLLGELPVKNWQRL